MTAGDPTSTPFDRPAIDRYAAGSEAGTIRALRGDGITHLLVSDPELRRAHASTTQEFMTRHFPSGRLPLLFDRSGVRVYELPPAGS